MEKKKHNKDRSNISITKLAPNMVTLLGLCIGLSAIRFALKENYEFAVGFVILASCIDAIDGRLARRLNATSSFGAQLDSLADFLNFGVAPPFILYLWLTHEVKGFGWALVLLFVSCAAIRLARFNSDLDNKKKSPPWTYRFFKGVPSPAGAMMALGPLIVTFAFESHYPEFFMHIKFFHNPWFAIIYASIIAVLMASEYPTFSFKKLSIPRQYTSLLLVGVTFFVIAVLTEPWITMVGVGLWYYSTLPLSLMAYYRCQHQDATSSK